VYPLPFYCDGKMGNIVALRKQMGTVQYYNIRYPWHRTRYLVFFYKHLTLCGHLT
jgi:hypothetical protein